MENIFNGLLISELDCFSNQKGKVLHGIKKDSDVFAGFGEAYFSTVNFNTIKGWKKHNRMIMNLIVPVGSVRFYLYDEKNNDSDKLINQKIDTIQNNHLKHMQKDIDRVLYGLGAVGLAVITQFLYIITK